MAYLTCSFQEKRSKQIDPYPTLCLRSFPVALQEMDYFSMNQEEQKLQLIKRIPRFQALVSFY